MTIEKFYDVYIKRWNLIMSLHCTTLRSSFLFSDIDECSPNPCKNNGDCVQTFNASYLCGCKAGYTGVNCTESNNLPSTLLLFLLLLLLLLLLFWVF